MKRNIIITEIICTLLIFLFAYAGISKLADHASFQAQLGKFSLIKRAAPVISYLLPVFEIITALMLFVPPFKIYSLYVSFVLLVLITIYLVWMVLFNAKLPCSCGGVIRYLSWKQHIFFNVFFIIISAVGIMLQRRIIVRTKLNMNSLLQ